MNIKEFSKKAKGFTAHNINSFELNKEVVGSFVSYSKSLNGRSDIVTLLNDKGAAVKFYVKGGLMKKLLQENCIAGEFVSITFTGRTKIKKGEWKGKLAIQCRVVTENMLEGENYYEKK